MTCNQRENAEEQKGHSASKRVKNNKTPVYTNTERAQGNISHEVQSTHLSTGSQAARMTTRNVGTDSVPVNWVEDHLTKARLYSSQTQEM